MRCEEHLRRTLGTLSVALAYWSLLFIRYLPTYSEHKPNEKEISHGMGRGKHAEWSPREAVRHRWANRTPNERE